MFSVDFKNILKYKISLKISFSESRIIPCRWAEGHTNGQTDVQTDMKKLTGAFSKFANAPKMEIKLKGSSKKNTAIQENLNPNREYKKGKCEIKGRLLGKQRKENKDRDTIKT